MRIPDVKFPVVIPLNDPLAKTLHHGRHKYEFITVFEIYSRDSHLEIPGEFEIFSCLSFITTVNLKELSHDILSYFGHMQHYL